MTARFTLDAPLASADTWAGRLAKKTAAREAQIEAIWHGNMARRDAAAKAYGEPETPNEFYHGRPGSQAEKIVLDWLRELQNTTDNLIAGQRMDALAKMYLATAPNSKASMRRIAALLRIAGEKA